MQAELVSGAGNHFILVDSRGEAAPEGREAKPWCKAAAGGRGADGLLVLLESSKAAARLVIWNADGSLATACGNGLRCAGWYLLREAGIEEVLIETETGVRSVQGTARADGADHLVAELGEVRVEPLVGGVSLLAGERAVWRGDVGNPHCVFLVEDVRSAQFEERGASLQEDPIFARGVNVGYLAQQAGAWRLRVFERGVGETGACGTGAAAAAMVLHEALEVAFPVDLELPAGRLTVSQGEGAGLCVAGGVEHKGSQRLEWPARSPERHII